MKSRAKLDIFLTQNSPSKYFQDYDIRADYVLIKLGKRIKGSRSDSMAKYGQNEFKHEYMELVVEVFSSGGSMADFCVKVGNHRDTVYEWMKRYPAFRDAYYYARECGKAHRDKTAKANMWQSYGKEGENFDVASYLKLTQPRFKDMERETPPPEIMPEGEAPDLMGAIYNLVNASIKDQVTDEKAKAIAQMIVGALTIKEKEYWGAKLEEMERIHKQGAFDAGSPVISPAADLIAEPEPEKPKQKRKKSPSKKPKTKAKKAKDDN